MNFNFLELFNEQEEGLHANSPGSDEDFIVILFNSFIISSPECTIKISCDESCSDLKLINALDSTQTQQTLNPANPAVTTDYIQYDDLTFSCEPGDKIIFTNSNTNNLKNGGIIFKLDITDGTNTITIKSSTQSEKFTCTPSSCSLNSSKKLKFKGLETEENILEFSGTGNIIFELEIPYDYEIQNNNYIYANVLNSGTEIGKIFKFNEYVKPKLSGSETNGRLQVQIIEISRADDISLTYNDNSEIVNLNNNIELNK